MHGKPVSQVSADPLLTFKEHFGKICNLKKSDFEKKNVKTPSLFDRHVKRIIAAFNSKWDPSQARKEYIKTFSFKKWLDLDQYHRRATQSQNVLLVP